MQTPRKDRYGFTLVELLVALAIIGVLIALLVPAVQYAREAARRTQCRSNLKQLGLALHNYDEVHQVLPFGYVNADDTAGWGWGTMILPQLDQTPLYSALKAGTQDFDGVPTPQTQQTLSIFICPSDTGPNVNSQRGDHGKANYCGVAGSVEMRIFSTQTGFPST